MPEDDTTIGPRDAILRAIPTGECGKERKKEKRRKNREKKRARRRSGEEGDRQTEEDKQAHPTEIEREKKVVLVGLEANTPPLPN